MVDYIVGRNLGHLNRCVANVEKSMEIGSLPVRIHAFPPAHEWLRNNLPSCRLRAFSGAQLKNCREWFLKQDLIFHDWREEVRLLKQKRQQDGPILAGIYHSELAVSPDDTELTRKFKQQIQNIAQQTTDLFFHINLRLPEKLPDLSVYYVPIPPIVRNLTQTPGQVKKRLGIPEDEPFILVQMGGGIGKYRYRFIVDWYNKINRLKTSYRIVVASQLEPVDYEFAPPIIQAPLFENGRDLVNAASLVVSKPGMGILIDCITTGTPLLALPADTKERLVKNMMLAELVGSDVCIASNRFTADDLAKRIAEIVQYSSYFEQKFNKIPQTGAEVVARSMHVLAGRRLDELPDLFGKILEFTPFHSA
ncbi:glycosyltransferase [Effusibacillus pohliae]|uniref:glycosyltransferase n=1 Tax=Effusibacillus pohliae TaxID=232270 RepID=UPI0003823F30|nr:glycosyltransferase [Effusibacillus pohliae]